MRGKKEELGLGTVCNVLRSQYVTDRRSCVRPSSFTSEHTIAITAILSALFVLTPHTTKLLQQLARSLTLSSKSPLDKATCLALTGS